MTRSIVAHLPEKCKVYVNPKLNTVAESFKARPELHFRRAGEALSLSNEDAIEFLRSIGYSQVIPGTHFTPMRDYAKFLNVQWDSLNGYIQRNKLGFKDNPTEAFSTTIRHFFKVAGLLDKGEIAPKAHRYEPFDFCFTKTGVHYVTQEAVSIRFISARIAVAMIAIMANNPTYKWGVVSSMNDELIKFLRVKRDQAKAVADAAAAARAEAEAEAKEAAKLKAAIAEETLYELIKRAVCEVMSGAKIELAPTTNT